MSQENVEIARRWLATMSGGPEEALAALAEVAEAEAEYYPVRKFPEARPCHGLEQFAQFISDFFESYARIEWVIQEAYEVGDDRENVALLIVDVAGQQIRQLAQHGSELGARPLARGANAPFASAS